MSNQAKVGIVVILSIIFLGIIVTWKSAILFKFTGYELRGSFENIEGLTTGSEIRYRGFKVGKVMRIDAGPEDIRIYCVIDKDIKFPSDSKLRVAFDGLVGLKYLEIRPGRKKTLYKTSQILYGQKTSGIVDFVDIGTQNLVETKKILLTLRNIIERPDIQNAFVSAVFNIERATVEINRLTEQLQLVASSINQVVANKDFQENMKGTVASTHKTLTSANEFFEGFGKLKVKPTADLLIGGMANQFKGNLDIKSGDNSSVIFSMGEGPTRNLALLDLQIANAVSRNLGLRIGMINTHLGGGLDYYMNRRLTFSGDIYDINNTKPKSPKFRLTGEYRYADYVNLLLQADDFLNGPDANYSFGVRVKGRGD